MIAFAAVVSLVAVTNDTSSAANRRAEIARSRLLSPVRDSPKSGKDGRDIPQAPGPVRGACGISLRVCLHRSGEQRGSSRMPASGRGGAGRSAKTRIALKGLPQMAIATAPWMSPPPRRVGRHRHLYRRGHLEGRAGGRHLCCCLGAQLILGPTGHDELLANPFISNPST